MDKQLFFSLPECPFRDIPHLAEIVCEYTDQASHNSTNTKLYTAFTKDRMSETFRSQVHRALTIHLRQLGRDEEAATHLIKKFDDLTGGNRTEEVPWKPNGAEKTLRTHEPFSQPSAGNDRRARWKDRLLPQAQKPKAEETPSAPSENGTDLLRQVNDILDALAIRVTARIKPAVTTASQNGRPLSNSELKQLIWDDIPEAAEELRLIKARRSETSDQDAESDSRLLHVLS